MNTVDRENFGVKIISQSTTKFKHAKKNLLGDDQWIGARKSTPPEVNVYDYIQPAIPGSPDTW